MENVGTTTTSPTEVSFSQAGDSDSPPSDSDSLVSENEGSVDDNAGTRKSTRIKKVPDPFGEQVCTSKVKETIPDPKSYKNAISCDEWNFAMKNEMASIYDNDVWNLTPSPEGCDLVPYKWVKKRKFDSDGNLHRCISRLVTHS